MSGGEIPDEDFIRLPFGETDFWKENTYSLVEVLSLLQFIHATEKSISDDSRHYLSIIYAAILGIHPHFKLNYDTPTKGKTFRGGAMTLNRQVGTLIAKRIEMAVSTGAKLEAEVAKACHEHNISRRQVFRILASHKARKMIAAEPPAPLKADERDSTSS